MMKRLLTLILALLIAVSACSIVVSAADLTATGAENYPVLKTAAATKDGIRISWNSFPKAVKYRVFYKANDAKSWKTLGDTANLYYDHKNAPIATKLYYTVRAMDKQGNYISGYYKSGILGMRYNAPSVTKLEALANKVRITVADAPIPSTLIWDMPSIESLILDPIVNYYMIYAKGGTYGTGWKAVAVTDSKTVSIPVDRKNSGVKLTFTVRTISPSGVNRSYFNAGKSMTYVAPPTYNINTVNSGQLITVNKVKGASKYRIFVRENSKWKKLGDTTTSFINKNVTFGNTYNYTVRAMNASGQFVSGYYDAGVSCDYLKAPKLLKAAQDFECLKITWKEENPTRCYYKVFRKAEGDTSWTSLGYITSTYYKDYDAKPGVKYTYTARCADENGHYTSYYDTKGISQTYYNSTEIYAAEGNDEGIVLYWDESDVIDSYRVFVKNGTSWKAVATTKDTQYTYKNVTDKETYTFTVRGLDKNGKYCTGYYEPGFIVTYRKGVDAKVDEERLKNGIYDAVSKYNLEQDDSLTMENAAWTFAADLGCYGKNCGNVTPNLITMAQERIDRFCIELIDVRDDYLPQTYRIIEEEYDGGIVYFVCFGYSN